MTRILCVFGTRPEAIKMAPVIKELRRHREIESAVCVTAQHREMLDQVLDLFRIEPDYDLNIMEDDQSLSYVTARVLTGVETVIEEVNPDWVLVQGDTTTTMAASLAAFYQQVKVGHVEAGLRTWDKSRPYPEEANRKMTDGLCDLHFAPTNGARENLLREGISDESVLVTGNTVIDALLEVASRSFAIKDSPLRDVPFENHRIVVVTVHRRETFGQPLRSICLALRDIADSYLDDVHMVYPVHLNPNVWRPVNKLLGNISNMTLLQPLDYEALVHLMKRSFVILTDSGGIQEEAPSLGVPVLVLREVTERPEGVAAGTAKVVGTDRERIVSEAARLLEDGAEHALMAGAVNPYGDGRAADRIVARMLAEPVETFRTALALEAAT